MIDLNDDQLQDIIQSILNKDEGLNELLELILNGLMKIERTQWMASNSGPGQQVQRLSSRPGHRPRQKTLAAHPPRPLRQVPAGVVGDAARSA